MKIDISGNEFRGSNLMKGNINQNGELLIFNETQYYI